MRALYWFRTDLRLDDSPGLDVAAQADELLCVYLWPKHRPWCNLQGMGAQRARFLTESLQALNADLQQSNQSLLMLEGSAELVLPDLVRDYRIDILHCASTPGSYEARAISFLRERLNMPIQEHRGNTLFSRSSLKAALPDLPGSFTPFRKAVEQSLAADAPATAATPLPRPPAARFHRIPPASERAALALPLRGGSAAGRRRLQQFISEEQRIRAYKETRNCLDPLDGSSTLSPWLATGNLSVRAVAAAIGDHEARFGANDSTYWLYFELLWREYFHWRALEDGSALFRAGGRRGAMQRCTFEPRNFARWCAGDTDFPLVNALMHQLVTTGWMSNRGRQIAASCLMHEYGIDWRYGAAFFEKHLIDFDVASNYGNWQYIAGVGADPRGGRKFNIEKQAAQYDPEGHFTAKWDGYRSAQPRYVTDAADWPI
jgi:deoxyribodipyrimidine photo-lyase